MSALVRFVVVATVVLIGTPALASPPTEPESLRPCVRGKKAPECDLIFLLESALYVDISNDRILWNIGGGLLVNVAAHSGVGISADVQVNEIYSRYSVRGRYRYWLTRSTSLEFAGGVLFPRARVNGSNAGALVGTAINFGDSVSLTFEADRFAIDDNNHHSVTLGLRIGAMPLFYGIATALGLAAQSDPQRPRWMGGDK